MLSKARPLILGKIGQECWAYTSQPFFLLSDISFWKTLARKIVHQDQIIMAYASQWLTTLANER